MHGPEEGGADVGEDGGGVDIGEVVGVCEDALERAAGAEGEPEWPGGGVKSAQHEGGAEGDGGVGGGEGEAGGIEGFVGEGAHAPECVCGAGAQAADDEFAGFGGEACSATGESKENASREAVAQWWAEGDAAIVNDEDDGDDEPEWPVAEHAECAAPVFANCVFDVDGAGDRAIECGGDDEAKDGEGEEDACAMRAVVVGFVGRRVGTHGAGSSGGLRPSNRARAMRWVSSTIRRFVSWRRERCHLRSLPPTRRTSRWRRSGLSRRVSVKWS